MLSLMHQVINAIEMEDIDRSKNILDELICFTKGHFRREEKFLRDIDYPSTDQHKAYHDELLLRAISAMYACKAITSKSVFHECCEEMFAFLIDDVVTGDLKLKSYLQAMGYTPTR